MTLEFIFEDIIYKYENGKIYYRYDRGYNYDRELCEVLPSLDSVLDMLGDGQRIDVLENIVQASISSYMDGKKAKVAEIKAVLDIR